MPASADRLEAAELPLVYRFRQGEADGGAGDAALLGGKGANLAEMARVGLPVPPGFTITTEVCVHGMRHGGVLPEGLTAAVAAAVAALEAETGARFGGEQPLLLSVRSGARVSMPGMMDTVLNIGLNDALVERLAAWRGDARWAWDCYRRFVQMYANVVLGANDETFDALLAERKAARGLGSDLELGADDWREVVTRFRAALERDGGLVIPDDPREQLERAIAAVFGSWNTPRAIAYRRIHAISDEAGTAANVMAMVYGNLDDRSGSGVVFTRNPATGEPRVYGEFLACAQGEDVVAGIRTPGPLAESDRAGAAGPPSLERILPDVHAELTAFLARIERHFRDAQDVEFTVESGKLWILQTRSAKRTGRAAVRIALDLLDEGVLASEADVVGRVDPVMHVPQLLHPAIDPGIALPAPFAEGLAASPGAACGRIVFHADEAVASAEAGEDVVLVREMTSADDVHGMHAAKGILTATGGLTSHAAVVARGMGVPCVCGASRLDVDAAAGAVTVGGARFVAGDWITIDGTAGRAYPGKLALVRPGLGAELARFMTIADRYRRLRVLANADTPEDAARARELGAEGIGLCRTEHMFFESDERLDAMRAMVLADGEAERAAALDRLLPFQRDDFAGIFRAMDGLPVTIRLLDPPLHEFLPSLPEEIDALASHLGLDTETVRTRVARMHEQNPMLGFRGCRIGVAYPEVYAMQVRAIVEGALVVEREGARPRPEIMIPLVAFETEIEALREAVEGIVSGLVEAAGSRLRCKIGTMIELPRAALAAGAIARHAEFFSFGTNDLTQTALGMSRDDSGHFLPAYVARGFIAEDPFVSIDVEGVGELMRIALERGRAVRPDLEVGICGEHGGDPSSVAFCHALGIDYVSCSAYRVPVARLAAAQAALAEG